MHHLFETFAPDAHGEPLPDARVRPATAADLAVAGRLSAEREGEGVDAHRWTERYARRWEDPDHTLLVAEVGDEVVGFGWVSYLRPVASGGHGAPDGWYLSGVVVAPEYRRRGLGQRLTQARIDWVLDRANEVHYVVSASNLASRRLHAALGFDEVTRNFALPGVVFGQADGILCRLGGRPDADVLDLASRRA